MTRKYQTVSIWWLDHGYAVRGYYRAASYLIEHCDTLEEAVQVAFSTERKQRSVALVPTEEELRDFADRVAKAMGGSE